jgi:hypothetical protein
MKIAPDRSGGALAEYAAGAPLVIFENSRRQIVEATTVDQVQRMEEIVAWKQICDTIRHLEETVYTNAKTDGMTSVEELKSYPIAANVEAAENELYDAINDLVRRVATEVRADKGN